MSQEAFLVAITQALEKAGIPFMVAGSHGSSFHGQPRATNDIDLIIDPTAQQLDDFLHSLGDCYYVSSDGAREALLKRSMFNVIDFGAGWKTDLIIRKIRPFSIEEFRRRQMGSLHSCQVPIASAEDVILTKLEWDKITPSERQINDALGVALAKWVTLDKEYLRKWAVELGVAQTLEKVLQQAEKAQP